MTAHLTNPWDDYAEEFGQFAARRERADLEQDPIISSMLTIIGDVSGREVLDACCGEGFFTRVLARRGARVIGIDLSPRLIEMARAKDTHGSIDYRVADLSQPLPELKERFELMACHLALNDVSDYEGFVRTLFSLAQSGGRLVLAFNNPYSSVVREHITNYFQSGAIGVYGGLSSIGVKAHYYHRTLDDYLDAFLGAGFRLAKLADVRDTPERTFPLFMVLAFDKR